MIHAMPQRSDADLPHAPYPPPPEERRGIGHFANVLYSIPYLDAEATQAIIDSAQRHLAALAKADAKDAE